MAVANPNRISGSSSTTRIFMSRNKPQTVRVTQMEQSWLHSSRSISAKRPEPGLFGARRWFTKQAASYRVPRLSNASYISIAPAPVGGNQPCYPVSAGSFGEPMAKEDVLEFPGVVTELLPSATFRVKLGNDHEIKAHTAGKLRKNRIRVLAGDKVLCEMTPYDLTKGRLVY